VYQKNGLNERYLELNSIIRIKTLHFTKLMARDSAKYRIHGTEQYLPKGKLVLSCLKQFFSDVIVNSYDDVLAGWPHDIQGTLGVARKLDEVDNERYFFMEEVLKDEKGGQYVVCNQWGASNFDRFLERATQMGYPIEKEGDSAAKDQLTETQAGQTQKLSIEILGLCSQILQGTCEDNEDAALEENPYDGIHVNFFKIDSDQEMRILLDDQLIFQGAIQQLGLDQQVNIDEVSFSKNHQISTNLDLIRDHEKIAIRNEHGESCLYLQPDHGLFVLRGSADQSSFQDSELPEEERYALVDYGWYHLQTTAITVSDFSIHDLIFMQDDAVVDFLNAENTEECYYAFSHLLHKNGQRLEFEILENKSKALDIVPAWIQDV